MKAFKTPTEILLEIESVNVDIFQLSTRLASTPLNLQQAALNSRFLAAAIDRRRELRDSLKIMHGVHINVLNVYEDYQRTAV